jgi:DNA-binding GntR family transcriptional regulator
MPGESDDEAIGTIEPIEGEPKGGGGVAAPSAYEPMGQAIARRVRDAIQDGRLGPGVWIRQESLARHLGVSRIPVREALRQLESEGFVTLVPHSGARVARMDLAEHLELYRIREALEPLAIAESAMNLNDDQLAHLRELADGVGASVADPLQWLDYDRRFHLESYAAAPLPRLLHMIEALWNITQQYRRVYLTTLDERDLQLVAYEHALILDALERRDPVDAEMRQRSHIRRTRLTLSQRKDLFDTDE